MIICLIYIDLNFYMIQYNIQKLLSKKFEAFRLIRTTHQNVSCKDHIFFSMCISD